MVEKILLNDFFSSDITSLQLQGIYFAKAITSIRTFYLPQSSPEISNLCHCDLLLSLILYNFESLKPPLGGKCQLKLWLIQLERERNGKTVNKNIL